MRSWRLPIHSPSNRPLPKGITRSVRSTPILSTVEARSPATGISIKSQLSKMACSQLANVNGPLFLVISVFLVYYTTCKNLLMRTRLYRLRKLYWNKTFSVSSSIGLVCEESGIQEGLVWQWLYLPPFLHKKTRTAPVNECLTWYPLG